MKQKTVVRVVCIVLAVILIASVFAVAIPMIAANAATKPVTGGKGYISDDYVNLRSGAGTGYSVLTCMREDTEVTFESGELYGSDWYKITEKETGKTGYVHKSFVTATDSGSSGGADAEIKDDDSSSSSSGSTGVINADYVNLRTGAGTGNSVVTVMRKDTKFTLVSESPTGDWYNIKTSDGKTGWVIKDYIIRLVVRFNGLCQRGLRKSPQGSRNRQRRDQLYAQEHQVHARQRISHRRLVQYQDLRR